ncbi:MAG: M28 family peptidase [Alphaproteobacteria bacterium]|nr:M28 family peptidase [Alphaproteobacteria bacterium]
MTDHLPAILKDVAIDFPWELVERFAQFPRWKPEDVNASCDMMVERLKKHGVPVTVHEPELHLSIPYEASVAAEGKTYRAKPPAYSKSMPQGLEGELVYVPASYAKSVGTLMQKNQVAELSKPERIRGKIVISEGFAFPHKIHEFEQSGAIGVIAVNPGVDIHWGICTSIWGTPDLDDLPRKPAIPVVAVNNPDGKTLIALAERGGRAMLRSRLDEGWFRQKLPVVEIPGKARPEEFVLLHGHYDSWDVGIGDNATGNATLLEVARVLWKHRDKMANRGVRIAWWPGHSTGRYAGSTWFADAFAIDIDENCVAQINCDSPGCRWATVFKDVSWMKEAEGIAQAVIKEVTGLDSHGERPHRAGDYAFNNIGVSSLFMLSSTMPDALREQKGYYAVGGCGGNIAWHTENDTIDIADRDIMLRDIKVYLAAAYRIAEAEVLPFDWRAIAAEFEQTIARYQAAAGDRFDLAPAAAAASELKQALDRLHAGIAAKRVPAAAANRVVKRLARILVPINHTRGARFRHDPAVPVPPLPGIAVCADLGQYPGARLGFALTQAMRGRNRLVAALREARRLVEEAGA